MDHGGRIVLLAVGLVQDHRHDEDPGMAVDFRDVAQPGEVGEHAGLAIRHEADPHVAAIGTRTAFLCQDP